MATSKLVMVMSAAVAVGVVAAGATVVAIRSARPDAPTAQVSEIREAHRDSLDAMRRYRGYLRNETSWSDNGEIGPCPGMIDGLEDNAVETDDGKEGPGRYTFLYFDGDENRSDESDDTKLALFEGTPEDLANADNVVFFVPGTGTSWANGFSFSQPSLGQGGLNCYRAAKVKSTNWIGSANAIRDAAVAEAPDQTTVVVAWLGYDAPRASTGDKSDLAREVVTGATPASSLFADEGGEILAEHLGRFIRERQHLSLVGHSYGSGPIGYSLWKYGARGVDDVIGGGAPGLAVRRILDIGVGAQGGVEGECLGYSSAEGVGFPRAARYTRQCLGKVPENHFWALQSPDDWLLGGRSSVCWVASGPDVCGFFGDTLHGERFGAHEMSTNAKGFPKQSDHGDYFKKLDGERTLALINTARVVVGRYGDVKLESAAPDIDYPGDRTPESVAVASTTVPRTAPQVTGDDITREQLVEAMPRAGLLTSEGMDREGTFIDDAGESMTVTIVEGDKGCRPLIGDAPGEPRNVPVTRTEYSGGDGNLHGDAEGKQRSVEINRYLSDDPAGYMRDLRARLASCFSIATEVTRTSDGTRNRIRFVLEMSDTPDVGDEAVLYRQFAVNETTGSDYVLVVLVVRYRNSLTWLLWSEDYSPDREPDAALLQAARTEHQHLADVVAGLTPEEDPGGMPDPAVAVDLDWGSSPARLGQEAETGSVFSGECPPRGLAASIWGTDTYTSDSSICTAAVHEGLISRDKGGAVTYRITAGADRYVASTRNGVTSNSWGAWNSSFEFV